MAKRSQHSFLKRQKEMKRKDEAAEKMARRQGKAGRTKGPEEGEPEGAAEPTNDETSS
jgi:hypothetical protein